MIDLKRSAVARDIADSNVILRDHLSLGSTTLHCPALACLNFPSNFQASLYDHSTMTDALEVSPALTPVPHPHPPSGATPYISLASNTTNEPNMSKESAETKL